ncbi:MAG: right-handed parallel beta-helix repeat-containing protein [Candidatus Bathyarchaeia archaeon]
MPLKRGIPYQPYSFLIKKLDGLIVAQDDKGVIRFSGTDASTVIQSAINALPSTYPGKIFIKEGNYVISSTIVISIPDLFIEGMGYSTILRLKPGANISMLELKDGTRNFRMADIYLRGEKSLQTAVGHGIFLNNTAEVANWRLTNVIISHFKGCGIYLTERLYASIFENCYIELNDASGIYSRKYFSNCEVKGCYIYSNGEDGIYLYLGCRNKFSNNYIVLNTKNGINFDTSYENEVIGNQISSNGLRNRIEGNLIERNGREGIYGFGGFSYNIIMGNHFHDNSQASTNTYNDIWLRTDGTRYCVNNVIMGNHFLGAVLTGNKAKYGIEESASTDDYNIISRNIFGLLGTAPVKQSGVNTKVQDNIGYITENSGTATITAGATYVDVTHGLAITPDINRIKVVPKDNLGGRSFWISDVGATTFRINISSVDTVDHAFGWSYD